MPNCRICNRPNASWALPTPLQMLNKRAFGHLGGFGDSSSFDSMRNYYCSYHQKPCPVYYCIERNERGDYCANHKSICQASSCSDRTASDKTYCSKHSKYCSESDCSQRIGEWQSYCSSHNGSYCRGISCYKKVSSSETYCFSCGITNRVREERQQAQAKASEQNQLKSLVKSNTSIAGTIQEVERFSPWFNPNCATVIAENNNYALYLVVYEPATKAMGKVIVAIKIADKSSLTEAKSKASELRTNLNGENPILAVFADADSYAHINRIITWPYIVERDLPVDIEETVNAGRSCGRVVVSRMKKITHISNPDDYLKPLDIVWIKRENAAGFCYYHVCVYLGNNQVCHISGDNQGAKIESWSEFVKDGEKELIRHHSIIPFKDYKKIARQITWASENNYRSGQYNLLNKNCEHFANSIVYGIDYSKQIENKKDLIRGSFDVGKVVLLGLPGFFIPKPTLNNDKGSTVNLKNEISNNSLGESSNYQLENRVEQAIPSHISTDRCVIM